MDLKYSEKPELFRAVNLEAQQLSIEKGYEVATSEQRHQTVEVLSHYTTEVLL